MDAHFSRWNQCIQLYKNLAFFFLQELYPQEVFSFHKCNFRDAEGSKTGGAPVPYK